MSEPRPSSFDPDQDVFVDAGNLRGIAHPLRLRMLGILREDGPATATMLAQRCGESSAATSYHLRQLAEHGFIVEDAARGTRRERWWRARHRMTYFNPTADATPEGMLLSAEYLRGVARAYAARMEAWVDALPTVPMPWRDAGTMSDYGMRLTAEQAQELIARLDEIGRSHPIDGSAEDRGAIRFHFQFQVLPSLRALDEAVEGGDGEADHA